MGVTDAEKREKVIRGLECCITCDPDGSRECKKCPYRRKGITNEPCFNALHADVLALLREQEPRVIDLSEISPNIYVWVEDRDDGTLFPLKGGVIDPDGDDYFRFDENIEKDFVYYPTGTFGKYWRVWNLQPTPEQMRDTPWEGEEIK
jgi:hypothetical protein